MAVGDAVSGVGSGLGVLFAALGRQKLRDSQNALMKAKWDQQQALANSEIDRNRVAADLGRNRLGGLQGIGDALSGLGYTPQQAAALSAYARANGGENLKNATEAAMELQIPVAGAAAVPQLGDVFQRALGRDTTKVADGVAYNPLGDSSQPTNVTSVGNAMIAAREAQAAASRASAVASLANAARARAGINADKASNYDLIPTEHGLYRVNKLTGQATPLVDQQGAPITKLGATPSASLPPVSSLAALLGEGYDKDTGLTSIPPEKVQQFLAWQAAKSAVDPRYANGAFALQHYASEAPIGTGINDSPEAVGAVPVRDLTAALAPRTKAGATSTSTSAPPAAAAVAATATPTTSPKKAKAPPVGITEDGYMFKGGDPSRKENWVKVSDIKADAGL